MRVRSNVHGWGTPCRRRQETRRALERMFIGKLSGDKQNELLEHVRTCEPCEKLHLRFLAAERATVHDGDPERQGEATHFESERLKDRILAQAAAVAEAEQRDREPARAWWVKALAWSSVVAVIGVIGGVWQYGGAPEGDLPGPRPHELVARGGAPAPKVAIRVLRISGQGDEQRMAEPMEARAAGAHPRLKLDDMMVALYTNRHQPVFAFVVGIGPGWEPLWYRPAPPRTRSVELSVDVADKPLVDPVRLKVNHRPGTLVIFSLLSPRPLTMDQVRQAIARAREGGGKPQGLERLPLPNEVAQTRMVYDIVK